MWSLELASGPLLGGNLSVLTRLIGTPHLPDLRGAILLLEEVNEAPYRLDRELSHLHLAGLLDRVAGVVVGQLHRCDAPQGHPPAMTRAVLCVNRPRQKSVCSSIRATPTRWSRAT